MGNFHEHKAKASGIASDATALVASGGASAADQIRLTAMIKALNDIIQRS